MVVWRKCPICGSYYPGTIAGGRCKCGYQFNSKGKSASKKAISRPNL